MSSPAALSPSALPSPSLSLVVPLPPLSLSHLFSHSLLASSVDSSFPPASSLLSVHPIRRVSAFDLLSFVLPLSFDFSFSCSSLNEIFRGEILELLGASGSFKTQLCIQAIVNNSLQGFTGLWIQVGDCLNVQRLREMGEKRRKTMKNYSNQGTTNWFNKIKFVRIRGENEEFHLLNVLEQEIQANQKRNQTISLIILDSFHSLFSHSLGQNKRGQALLSIVSRRIKRLACQYKIAFIFTNVPSAAFVDRLNLKSGLGERWKSHADKRILCQIIQEGDEENRKVVKIIIDKSSREATGESVLVTCSGNGVEEIKQ
jgi:RecA/RadA recombinase